MKRRMKTMLCEFYIRHGVRNFRKYVRIRALDSELPKGYTLYAWWYAAKYLKRGKKWMLKASKLYDELSTVV